MHVYEPRQKRIRRKNKYTRVAMAGTVSIIVLLGGFVTVKQYLLKNAKGVLGNSSQNGTSSASTGGTFKYLSGYDFKKIYDESALPNTKKLFEPVSITGNQPADARIRQIAESRGYAPQAVPKQEITTANDNALQPLVREAWQQLKQTASKDKVQLQLVGGYQTIEMQRQLFVARLSATGVRTDQIESGKADGAVVAAMTAVVPPGYSRQHTGYAIEVSCPNESGKAFEFTSCSNWLKANNYAKPRQVGFIPSRADAIGIDSTSLETAEYVWVGTSKIY